MRQRIKQSIFAFACLAVGLTACKKDNIQTPAATSNQVQFTINPAQVNGTPDNLFLVVTLKNGSGEEVVRDRKLPVTNNGNNLSGNLDLANGAFKLTKFLVTDSSGKVYFATPVNGSVKAANFQRPLHIDIVLSKTGVLEIPVDVLAIQPGDKPQSFGYPEGTFQHAANIPDDAILINLQAVVTVGNITYDSIPALFTITSWDENEIAYRKDTMLSAGMNRIGVPKSHKRFTFQVNKWGITDIITLEKAELQSDVIYTLGGRKEFKRLLREESFRFAAGTYSPSAKIIYTYKGEGISQIDFYQKKPESSELQFTRKHAYHYNGNNVARIDVLNQHDSVTGFSTYDYNAQGTRIESIRDVSPAGETGAAVAYSFANGYGDITIDYLFSNGHSMQYNMKIVKGNKVEDAAATSRGGAEGGKYTYDFNINPFAHMNIPNLYLSNLSKNNMISREKSYSGAYPVAEPYKFDYTYDNEGYPVELIKHFKNYQTGEHLYKIKTVYFYS